MVSKTEIVNDDCNTHNEDIIQKSIGVLGRWQIGICIAIFLMRFPVAWHQLNIVFEAPPAQFSCKDQRFSQCSVECPDRIFNRSVFTQTIITQWDLVCNRAYLANLAQTITMLGILIGNILFGYLSDHFGRRIPLVVGIGLQAITGTCTVLLDNLYFFLSMRFVTALATGGTMITSFVLVMEIIGLKWRTTFGILYQIPFIVGHLIMPLFAYYLRDWKHFQLAISLPCLIFLTYYWFIPESPRWLLSVNKTFQAAEVMKRAALINRLPDSGIDESINLHMQQRQLINHGGNFLDLIKTTTMRKYTSFMAFNWLVCGLCYFGVAQYIGQMQGDIFVNVAFSALIQFPGTLFSIWALKKWGRRRTLIISNTLAGIAFALIGILPTNIPYLRIILACTALFGMSISFPTVYIYAGELFPTIVRNIGMGTCSVSARVGSMVAPFLTSFGSTHSWIPPLLFGLSPIIGAILSCKLPETLDCKLTDTIEEAEMFDGNSTNKSNRIL